MCGRYDAGRSDNIEEPAGEYLNIFSIPLRTYLTHLCKSAMDELNQKEIELRRRNDEIDAKRNRKVCGRSELQAYTIYMHWFHLN